MAEIQNLADYKVAIDGRAYDLLTVPPKDSPIVQQQKEKILDGLSLDEVVRGLARARKLYWCAYNGVAGFANLRNQVTTLQDELAQLSRKTIDALGDFDTQSTSVLTNMNKVFKYLVQPGEMDVALGFLKSCASAASRLSDKAGTLANDFDKLADKTFATSNGAAVEQGLSEQQKRDYEQKNKELQGRIAKAEVAAKEFDKLSKDYKQKYEEAHHDAEKESERAFISSIVSAVTKPFSAGLGAFSQAYAQKNPAVAAATVANASQAQNQAEQDGGQAQPPAAANTSPAGGPTGPSTGKQAAAAGAAAAAEQSAKSISEAADKAADSAKSARDKEIAIIKAQQAVDTARIEQVSLLAQFAVDLKNVSEQIGVSNATIMSLQIAIGALRTVATSLRNASMFWSHMKVFCDRLNDPDSGLQADVQRMNGLSAEKQIKYFKGDEDFKADVVTYYAGWLALSLVVQEYRAATMKVRDGLYEDIKKNPDTRQSIALAQSLGDELLAESEADLKSLRESEAERKAALAKAA